ncbi:hypothetical protein Esti_001032 [Eimeria stiedai]
MEVPEKLAFYVSWDTWGSGEVKELVLFCYPRDCTVELRNVHNGCLHLKRVQAPRSVLQSLFVGAQLVLFSRHLRILETANEQTAAYLRVSMEPVMCICQAGAINTFAETLQQLLNAGLVLTSCRLVELRESLANFAQTHAPAVQLQGDTSVTATSTIAYFLLRGKNAAKEVAAVASSKPSFLHSAVPPGVSPCAVEGLAKRLNEEPGEMALKSGSRNPEVTCCVIKPHALQQTGMILRTVLCSGLAISAMQSFRMTHMAASEFLEVYNTVLKEYPQMVEEMTNGTVITLQLEGTDAVTRLRRLAGPYDPEVGRYLHPETLRAKLGESVARNALHCTDLAEDGPLECSYFFELMRGKSLSTQVLVEGIKSGIPGNREHPTQQPSLYAVPHQGARGSALKGMA